MGQFYKAAKAADVASGKLNCVEIAGKRVALFRVGEEIYALGDLCAHAGGRISDALSDRIGQDEVETIYRYNVRLADGDVEIEIEQ